MTYKTGVAPKHKNAGLEQSVVVVVVDFRDRPASSVRSQVGWIARLSLWTHEHSWKCFTQCTVARQTATTTIGDFIESRGVPVWGEHLIKETARVCANVWLFCHLVCGSDERQLIEILCGPPRLRNDVD